MRISKLIKRSAIAYGVLVLAWLPIIVATRNNYAVSGQPDWVPIDIWVALQKLLNGLGGMCMLPPGWARESDRCWPAFLDLYPSARLLTYVFLSWTYLLVTGDNVIVAAKNGERLGWKRPIWITLIILLPFLGPLIFRRVMPRETQA